MQRHPLPKEVKGGGTAQYYGLLEGKIDLYLVSFCPQCVSRLFLRINNFSNSFARSGQEVDFMQILGKFRVFAEFRKIYNFCLL
jgi:hypothetical protein